MKQVVTIKNSSSSISAEVLPECGGMVWRIVSHGKEILYRNEAALDAKQLLAGGVPVLFPFSSKTKDDTYELYGKRYHMPIHGFVKDMAFDVISLQTDKVVLSLKSDEITKTMFPFDFEFLLIYQVLENSVMFNAMINNKTDKEMPFYIGWHPYFFTTDRSKTSLDMKAHYYLDYTGRGNDDKMQPDFISSVKLSDNLDTVFYPIVGNKIRMENNADGYAVDIIMDELHDVATIFNGGEGFVCIEPWTALPDSINTKERLKWVHTRSILVCGFELVINIQ